MDQVSAACYVNATRNAWLPLGLFWGLLVVKKKKKNVLHRSVSVDSQESRCCSWCCSCFFCFLCFLSIKTVFIWIISCGNKRKDNWKGRDNPKTSNISHQQCETDVKTMLISHFPMWKIFDLMWLKKNSLTSKPHQGAVEGSQRVKDWLTDYSGGGQSTAP